MAVGFTSLASCSSRRVVKVIPAATSTGLGVRLHRTLGLQNVTSINPFVALIEFCAVSPFGFPERPMAGLETVTVLLQGRWRHEDCHGNRGDLHAGDVQRLFAGAGTVQGEGPNGEESARGLSIWVDVPASTKKELPSYQILPVRNIPKIDKKGVKINLISGQLLGRTGPVKTRTSTLIVYLRLALDSDFEMEVPTDWNACVYVIEGRGLVGPTDCQATGDSRQLLYLSSDAGKLRVENGDEDRDLQILVLAGQPLRQEIERRGPFAMVTPKELEETIDDFKLSKNAFVKAKGWRSSFSVK